MTHYMVSHHWRQYTHCCDNLKPHIAYTYFEELHCSRIRCVTDNTRGAQNIYKTCTVYFQVMKLISVTDKKKYCRTNYFPTHGYKLSHLSCSISFTIPCPFQLFLTQKQHLGVKTEWVGHTGGMRLQYLHILLFSKLWSIRMKLADNGIHDF
jgi:hypothetical protein